MVLQKIAMVSYYYPPLTGVGTKRISLFVNELAKMGIKPIIVTVDPRSIQDQHRVYGIVDPQSAFQVLTDTPKIEVPISLFSNKLFKFLRRYLLFRGLTTFFSIPDPHVFWVWSLYQSLVRLVVEQQVQTIFITAPPFSSLLAGVLIKRKFPGISLITDWRDEWTSNIYFKAMSPIHKWICVRLEKWIQKNSDQIVTVTSDISEIFQAKNGVSGIQVIENAFLPQFYQIKPQATEQLVLSYAGSVYGKMVPDTLIEAIEQLVFEGNLPREQIILRFMGANQSYISNQFTIENYPFMALDELVKMISQSNSLLVFLPFDAGHVYTAKIFDCIATGIPLLALVPDQGLVAELIEKTNSGWHCPLEDIDSIKIHIQMIYRLWQQKQLSISPNWDVINLFSPQVKAQQLIKIISTLETK